MTRVGYGSFGVSNEPKELALKFLKKVILNHKNALKFAGLKDLSSVQGKFINSVHILEELDMMLNHEDANNGVALTSKLIRDILSDSESIIDSCEEERLDKEHLEERVNCHLIVLDNLYEGFKGMPE